MICLDVERLNVEIDKRLVVDRVPTDRVSYALKRMLYVRRFKIRRTLGNVRILSG